MLRDFPNPIDTAIFQGDILIETPGNRFGNDRLLVALQFGYHLLLQSYQVVYLAAPLVEVVGYGLLLVQYWKW